MRITAAVLHANGAKLVLEPVELADPLPDELRVRLVATGMCHTDIMIMDHMPLAWPGVLGHEGAGIVDAIGANVEDVKIGDHVILCQPSCGTCENCIRGQPSYCLEFAKLCMAGGSRPDGSCTHAQGDTPLFGQFLGQSSFATHAIVHQRCVVPIDRAIPLDVVAPLSCGVQTGAGAVMNSLYPKPGDSFVVFGAGAVGLSALMAAKIAGCYPLIAVDTVDDRLTIARQLGASHVIDAKQGDVVATVRAVTGRGVDGAIEATGNVAVMQQAIASLAHNGTAVLVSAAVRGSKIEIDPGELQMRGLAVKSSLLCGEGTSSQAFIPKLIEWWQAGLFAFDKLAHYYDFSQINQARHDAETGLSIKPIMRFEHDHHSMNGART